MVDTGPRRHKYLPLCQPHHLNARQPLPHACRFSFHPWSAVNINCLNSTIAYVHQEEVQDMRRYNQRRDQPPFPPWLRSDPEQAREQIPGSGFQGSAQQPDAEPQDINVFRQPGPPLHPPAGSSSGGPQSSADSPFASQEAYAGREAQGETLGVVDTGARRTNPRATGPYGGPQPPHSQPPYPQPPYPQPPYPPHQRELATAHVPFQVYTGFVPPGQLPGPGTIFPELLRTPPLYKIQR